MPSLSGLQKPLLCESGEATRSYSSQNEKDKNRALAIFFTMLSLGGTAYFSGSYASTLENTLGSRVISLIGAGSAMSSPVVALLYRYRSCFDGICCGMRCEGAPRDHDTVSYTPVRMDPSPSGEDRDLEMGTALEQ